MNFNEDIKANIKTESFLNEKEARFLEELIEKYSDNNSIQKEFNEWSKNKKMLDDELKKLISEADEEDKLIIKKFLLSKKK